MVSGSAGALRGHCLLWRVTALVPPREEGWVAAGAPLEWVPEVLGVEQPCSARDPGGGAQGHPSVAGLSAGVGVLLNLHSWHL